MVSTNAFWYVIRLNRSKTFRCILGDIDRLKEYTLCCFEYLLSKIHGLSIDQLLWEFDIICNNILDPDILLVQAILKTITNTVKNDPTLLAGEMILRLKNIKSKSIPRNKKSNSHFFILGRYNEHIETLYIQAHEWCEGCGEPVYVPLSSWISTIPPLTITVLPTIDGAFKIAPTTFNQHVFCTTRENNIAMYHIPSKKLVKKFTGKFKKKMGEFVIFEFRSYVVNYIPTINL